MLKSCTKKLVSDQFKFQDNKILLLCSRIYWSDWDPVHPRIESSNFDGTDRRIIVDAFVGMPNALDIDFERNELCWTDAGSQNKLKAQILPKIGELSFAGTLTNSAIICKQASST